MSDRNDLPDPAESDPKHPVNDDKSWFGAVLLADEIKRYCEDPSIKMIHPFKDEQLRPASYQLTLGDTVHLGGEEKRLLVNQPTILLPHQVAVVSTKETLNIPRFLIARWSLRVTNISEGLLWTGGPQVDPGWQGNLYCPIYNLSERPVPLYAGEPFFTMDFVRTTALTPEYLALKGGSATKKTWFTPERRTLAEHDQYRLHSAPYEALRELEEVRQFRVTIYPILGILFTALGGLVAALAFVAVRPLINPGEPPISAWFIFVMAFVIVALFVSFGAAFLTWRIYHTLAQFQRRH